MSHGDDHFYHFDSAQPLLRGLFTRKKEEKDVSKTVVRGHSQMMSVLRGEGVRQILTKGREVA